MSSLFLKTRQTYRRAAAHDGENPEEVAVNLSTQVSFLADTNFPVAFTAASNPGENVSLRKDTIIRQQQQTFSKKVTQIGVVLQFLYRFLFYESHTPNRSFYHLAAGFNIHRFYVYCRCLCVVLNLHFIVLELPFCSALLDNKVFK